MLWTADGSSATMLGDNINLNTILDLGVYVCGSNAQAANYQNAPTDKAFQMVVYSPIKAVSWDTAYGAYVIQHITTYAGRQYYRSIRNGATASTVVYDAWTQISTTTTTV